MPGRSMMITSMEPAVPVSYTHLDVYKRQVTKLTGEGAVKRRIMDMGITKGIDIFVRKTAPLGDPVEVTVRGYELSLRKADAEMILVEMCIRDRTRLVAVAHISNVFGRVNPVREITELAHRQGAVVVVDAAQSAPHIPIDVQALDADFLAFSGHKLMAPMGIGVLYGKKELLEAMPPFLTGGEMIERVSRRDAVYAPLPHKFEAGTVNAAGAAALELSLIHIWKGRNKQ